MAVSSVPRANLDALDASRALGYARLKSWAQDGTLLPVDVFAARTGATAAAIYAARDRDELFTLYIDGSDYVPAVLLGLPEKARAAICRALTTEPPTAKLLFCIREHGALRGLTLVDALPEYGLDEVVRVAQYYGDDARPDPGTMQEVLT